MSIIPLPEKIEKNGFLYSLVERSGLYAIYTQVDPKEGTKVGYEVFRVGCRINGGAFARKDIPLGQEYEHYPPNTEFGSSAWSFISLESAKECLEQLKSNSWKERVYKPPENDTCPAWSLSRAACFARDRNICQSCKKRMSTLKLTAHHIVSRENKGLDNIENLITLCRECHDEIEDLNLGKNEIIEYKKSQKIKVKPVKITDENIKDWHAWVYGAYTNPFMNGKTKDGLPLYA